MKLSLLPVGVVAIAASICACATEPLENASAADALEARPSLAPTCFAPPKHDCSFYVSCLEETNPCGADGYAVGYGDKYCNRFLENESLSERGAVWRDEVMVCLQRRAGRFLERGAATCEQIVDGAFDDHPACYTQPHASICDLPPGDWLSIVHTIDHSDLLSERGRRQISRTARNCLQGWAGAVFSPFVNRDVERVATPDELEVQHKRAIVEALAQNPTIGFDALRELAAAPYVETTPQSTTARFE